MDRPVNTDLTLGVAAKSTTMLVDSKGKAKMKPGVDGIGDKPKLEGKLMASAIRANYSVKPPCVDGGSVSQGGIITYMYEKGDYRGDDELVGEPVYDDDDNDIIDIEVPDIQAAADTLKNRWLAIGLLHTRRPYNPKFLFQEMSAAWRLRP